MSNTKKELLTEFRELIEVKYGDYHKWREIEPKLSKAFDTLLQSKDREWKEKIDRVVHSITDKFGGGIETDIALIMRDKITSSTKKEDV